MYIVDHDKQIAQINEMKQLRKNSQKYEVYYHHPYTNQMWKGFFPRANGDDLGPKLLRHEPPPANIEEQMNICLRDNIPENAIGLGIEWSARPELWPTIIQALEKQYAHYNRTQIKLFLENLKLEQAKEQLPMEPQKKESIDKNLSSDWVGNLIWRSRKIRMKRFFVLG